jgi:quinol monooxygenase YgiN
MTSRPAADRPGPLTLYAEFTALAGQADVVVGLVNQLVVDVRAEPGNLAFDAWVRSDRPSEFVVFESYRDRAAFEDHLGSAHSTEFNRRLTPLVEGGGSRLTWLSGITDAQPPWVAGFHS